MKRCICEIVLAIGMALIMFAGLRPLGDTLADVVAVFMGITVYVGTCAYNEAAAQREYARRMRLARQHQMQEIES